MALPTEPRSYGALSQDSDFNFNALAALASQDTNDSDSDGDTVDSEVEEAILAELYFRDVKSKSSGKRVSVARQLGSSEVRLDRASDGSCTSISFIMDNQRKRQRNQICDRPTCTSSNHSTPRESMSLSDNQQDVQVSAVQQANSAYKRIKTKSLATGGGAEKEAVISLTAEREGARPSEQGGEGYEGVREMEEWEIDSSSSDENNRSSDMDISDDSANSPVGQLYLEVDEKDEWHIVLKDVMGSDEYEKQYGGRALGRKFVKCFNCKQKGQHQSKACPHPIRHQVCYICAGYDHISSNCSNDFCTYCFQKQHRGKPCSAGWNRHTTCQRCYCTGHSESVCHEHWRQYHNTTTNTPGRGGLFAIEPSQQRQSKRVFCFNCGRKGHFGHECPKKRPRGFSDPLSPHIAAYDELNGARGDRKRKLANRHGSRHDSRYKDSPTRLTMNPKHSRDEGLLPTPPSLYDKQQETSFNGHWSRGCGRSPDDHRAHDHYLTHSSSRPYQEPSRYLEYSRHDSKTESVAATPPGLLETPHSPPLLHSRHSPFHTPPARGHGFSDDDCQIVDFQIQPQRTFSEPVNRHFPADRRFSRDTPDRRHSSLREEKDFPRTPLPSRHQQHEPQDFRDVLPPPAKLMRRQSEPYGHRCSPGHEQSHRRMMSEVDYRRRPSGYEQGFRGSERAVSLVQNHYKDSSYYRTHYGNR